MGCALLFEERTIANATGHILSGFGAICPADNPSFGYEFIGIVYGVDDFKIGVTRGRVPPVTGDLDSEAFVGIEDINTLPRNWKLLSPDHRGTVPEPGAAAILAVGALAILRRR